jgi:hypothetical protein
MADAADSKSAARKGVWVRLPPPAPACTWNRLQRQPEPVGRQIVAQAVSPGRTAVVGAPRFGAPGFAAPGFAAPGFTPGATSMAPYGLRNQTLPDPLHNKSVAQQNCCGRLPYSYRNASIGSSREALAAAAPCLSPALKRSYTGQHQREFRGVLERQVAMARILIILAVFGVLGCNRSAEVPSGPDQDWQALLKSQEEEIHRLEAEISKLRAQCRESIPLTDEEYPFPEPAAEVPSTPPAAAQQQPRPTVSRFSVTSPLSAGGRAQLVWKARIENTSEEAEKVAALFEAFDESGVSNGARRPPFRPARRRISRSSGS